MGSNVSTIISVPTAATPTTTMAHVPTNLNWVPVRDNASKPPKYACPIHWEGDIEGVSHLALISEMLPPLPEVPDDKLKNDVVFKTILENENLSIL
jgi:hypothetical protein